MSSSTSSSPTEPVGRARLRRHRYRRRPVFQGAYLSIIKLIHELLSNEDNFERFFGVTKNDFLTLQNMFESQINNRLSCFPSIRPIRARDRLAICLRFLASGRSFATLAAAYNIQVGIIDTIVREICGIIIEHLRPLVLPETTEDAWENVALAFRILHDMPNCVGALNGRYIDIEGYKPYVFLGLVDANHKFIIIDVGNYAGNPQAIWNLSDMSRRFDDDELFVPLRKVVDNYPVPLPYVVVAGNSFRPRDYLLKKFKETSDDFAEPQQIFNCRILPIKEVADEAMTRLRRRWQIIQSRMPGPLETAQNIILACVCLHNYFTEPAT